MGLFRKRAPRDPVADQLKSLAKQGAGMAKVAHLFAGMLVMLFSAASFIALGSEALARFNAATARGAFDLPDAISLAVVVLIVPAFDWGMLYAAHRVNLLITRQADKKEMRVHIGVIVLASLVEGASYIYMSVLYEHPATLAAWAIIIVRGLSAPLLAVYLAMARPLPVTPRDILYQGELAAGAGLLRDVAKAANDPAAALHEKMALYNASALMSDVDRNRLAKMMEAVGAQVGRATSSADVPVYQGYPTPAPETPPGGWYPTGGGTPMAMVPAGMSWQEHPTFPSAITPETIRQDARNGASSGLMPMSEEEARKLSQIAGLYAQAKVLLDYNPGLGKVGLRKALECRQETASGLWSRWYYETSAENRRIADEASRAGRARKVAQ